MDGAREYCGIFTKTEQHGRLYILRHYHARGKTFRIYVLPEGEKAIENAGINPPLNKDAIEVYGITGGQPGWTEKYGWLHRGPWCADFDKLVEKRKKEILLANSQVSQEIEARTTREKSRVKRLLSDY